MGDGWMEYSARDGPPFLKIGQSAYCDVWVLNLYILEASGLSNGERSVSPVHIFCCRQAKSEVRL